jgi:ribose transport system permease protein
LPGAVNDSRVGKKRRSAFLIENVPTEPDVAALDESRASANPNRRLIGLLPGRILAQGERFALPAIWVVLCIFFALLPETSSTFPTMGTVSTILGTQAVIVVLTLGLLIPMTAGDYDLSVAFNLTLSAMIFAILNSQHHWPVLAAMAVALAAGLAIGTVNGAIVALGIDPFIVTLGTGTFVGGIVFWISQSSTISGISIQLIDAVIIDHFLGIPLEFYYSILLAAVLWYVLEYTPVGRRLLYVGRGRNVARLSGIRVNRVRAGALIASGFISAVAGIIYVGSTGAADPTSGTTFLLPAFAAAFLGTTTIAPGKFNAWGAVIAVYFLVTGITGLELLGASTFVQDLFYGGALVVAVALSHALARRRAQPG